MALKTDDDGTEQVICGNCERLCEPNELRECPICRRPFCWSCFFRIGSRDYCGRACGEAYFFGPDDESEPED